MPGGNRKKRNGAKLQVTQTHVDNTSLPPKVDLANLVQEPVEENP